MNRCEPWRVPKTLPMLGGGAGKVVREEATGKRRQGESNASNFVKAGRGSLHEMLCPADGQRPAGLCRQAGIPLPFRKIAGCWGGCPGGKGSVSLYTGLRRQDIETEGRERPAPILRVEALPPAPAAHCGFTPQHLMTRKQLAMIHPAFTFALETMPWESALFPLVF